MHCRNSEFAQNYQVEIVTLSFNVPCGVGCYSGAPFIFRYSKICHLRSLFWTATCLVRPLYEVNLLCNSIGLMFIRPSFVRPPAFYGQVSLKILVAV